MRNAIVLLFLTMMCPLVSMAQTRMWEIRVDRTDNKKGSLETLSEVSLDSLHMESLFVTRAGLPMEVPVRSIATLSWRKPDVPVAGGIVLGFVLGGGVGYYLGNLLDSNSPDSQFYPFEDPTSARIAGTGLGAGLGAFAGYAIAAARGNQVLDIRRMSTDMKLAFLDSLLVGEGNSPWVRPTVLARQEGDSVLSPVKVGSVLELKNGSRIKGTIVGLNPDSTVRIQTSDGSVFLWSMSDVERISPDTGASLPAPVAAVSPSPVSPGASHTPPFDRKPRVGLYAGGAVPMSDFGSTDAGNTGAGFADMGFCLGGELMVPLGKYVSWYTSATLAINTLNESFIDAFSAAAKLLPPPLSDTRVADAGSWYSVWPMTGVKFESPSADNVNPFGFIQVGFVIGSYPSITFSNGSSLKESGSVTATSFAAGGGGGFTVVHKLTISIRYMSGDPEYLISGIRAKQPTSIVTFTLGVRF